MIDQLSSNGFALLGYIVSIGLMVGYALMLWLGHRAADRKARPLWVSTTVALR